MNEYQRQVYLSALGVENYMPRWRLALAPAAIVCDLPASDVEVEDVASTETARVSTDADRSASAQSINSAGVAPLMADVLRTLTLQTSGLAKSSPLLSLPSIRKSPATEQIPSFALSVWRSVDDVLVIDSRNTQLAFPTEALLSNLLRAVFAIQAPLGKEEVLRWPIVRDALIARTEDDARSALQVWLEVELERRYAGKLLLMGKNATQYFLPPDRDYEDILWQEVALTDSKSCAMVTPSLVELLQQPMLKRDLWKTLQSWQKTTNKNA